MKYYKGGSFYQLHSGNIQLETDEPHIFMHEFYHHLQNNTTIWGAERMNHFLQILGHISKMSSDLDTLCFPLNNWMIDEELMNKASSSTRKQLYQIYNHNEMWDYLELKKTPIPMSDRFLSNQPPAVIITKTDYYNLPGETERLQLGVIPVKEADGYHGYPIGGQFLAESGAFSLEQLHRSEYFPISELLLESSSYPYHAIPYIISQEMKDERMAYLASFLYCDLAMVVSTPRIGFVSLASFLGKLQHGMNEDDLLEWHSQMRKHYASEIEMTVSLEIEMLDESQKTLENLNSNLQHVLSEQIDMLIKGLNLRVDKPDFLVETLIKPFAQSDIGELISEFPPTMIQIGDSNTGTYDSYEILNRLYTLSRSIQIPYEKVSIYDFDEEDTNGSEQEKYIHPLFPIEMIDLLNEDSEEEPWIFTSELLNINKKMIDEDSRTIHVDIKIDENNTTDLDGLLLQLLNLDNKKLQYIGILE